MVKPVFSKELMLNWNRLSRRDSTKVVIGWSLYQADQANAWVLFDPEHVAMGYYGEPITTITVCVADYGYQSLPNEVIIKSYSENEGLLEALKAAGVVSEIDSVPCGFALAWKCSINMDFFPDGPPIFS